jgi:hypothetical protein
LSPVKCTSLYLCIWEHCLDSSHVLCKLLIT